MSALADAAFIQIVDAALADSVRRSGEWLACRPGCHSCCTGVFAIAEADAERLRAGLEILNRTDLATAAAVTRRSAASAERLRAGFPGDPATGILGSDENSLARFEEFANDEVCPVLDPATGTCDLYPHRPLTCRTFGPPVRTAEGALGVCELCFIGAPDAAIAHAEMLLPPEPSREGASPPAHTIVSFAIVSAHP